MDERRDSQYEIQPIVGWSERVEAAFNILWRGGARVMAKPQEDASTHPEAYLFTLPGATPIDPSKFEAQATQSAILHNIIWKGNDERTGILELIKDIPTILHNAAHFKEEAGEVKRYCEWYEGGKRQWKLQPKGMPLFFLPWQHNPRIFHAAKWDVPTDNGVSSYTLQFRREQEEDPDSRNLLNFRIDYKEHELKTRHSRLELAFADKNVLREVVFGWEHLNHKRLKEIIAGTAYGVFIEEFAIGENIGSFPFNGGEIALKLEDLLKLHIKSEGSLHTGFVSQFEYRPTSTDEFIRNWMVDTEDREAGKKNRDHAETLGVSTADSLESIRFLQVLHSLIGLIPKVPHS